MGQSIQTVCAYPVFSHFFLFSSFPFRLLVPSIHTCVFFRASFNLSKPKPFHHPSKNQTTIFPGEVILNRRIIERKSSVPTNYTIIYKYVRNRMGGQISYIEFDVTNCVSNRLAFDCRHVTCRIKSTITRTGVRACARFSVLLCVCDSILMCVMEINFHR